MTQDDPTGSDKEPPLTHGRRTPASVQDRKLARAKARRVAFLAVLNRLDLRPAEVARRAGLSNGNSLYNFIAGRSSSLAQATLEKIATALGVTSEELMGDPRLVEHSTQARRAVRPTMPMLIAEVGAGIWWRNAYLAKRLWVPVPVPSRLLPPAPAAFAVRLSGSGSEGLFPQGTIAICVSLKDMQLAPPSTCRVLVHRERRGLHQLSLQELTIKDGRAWLTPQSDDPAMQTVTVLPWPMQEPALSGHGRNGVSTSIDGIVIATWRPETKYTQP